MTANSVNQKNTILVSRKLLIFAICWAICFSILGVFAYFKLSGSEKIFKLSHFRSDFNVLPGEKNFKADHLNRSKRFIAYSRYQALPAGEYELKYLISATEPGAGQYQLEVVASRGRELISLQKVNLDRYPATLALDIKLSQSMEIVVIRIG